jgi:hypothetical protein
MKYVEDHFTDTDGTLIAAHTPDIDRPGGGWAAITGAWSIDGNEAITTSVADARALINTDLADGRFRVDLKIGGAADAAYLVFRSNAGVTNFWMAGLDDTLQQVVLQSAAALAFTTRAAKAFTLDEVTAYELKVICRADEIRVYVDDVLKITHVSNLYETQEYVGIYANSNPDAVFDDLVADERLTCHYCTTRDVKTRLGEQWTSGTTYDEMLEETIEEASRIIDEEKGWLPCHFAAADQAIITRYYDGAGGTEQQIDRFLDDASFAVAVDDDADGVYTAWVRNTDYITWPYNEAYINRLVLATDSDVSFTVGQKSVQVTGRLGAYDEPPAQVRKACVMMVARAFKRGMQMYQDTAAVEELGELKYTLAIDPEVDRILKNIPGRARYG